jgi:uncharacterized membrane protein YadS
VFLNSLQLLAVRARSVVIEVDTVCWRWPWRRLGLSTNLPDLRKAGAKPLALLLILFLWLVVGGALINRWMTTLTG